jgi:anti-sigma factor ChrR (cupin superfamily)
MYQYMSHCADCKWEDLEIDGVSSKVLYDATGSRTVVTKMAAGSTIPRHHHTHANETVYVLEGDFLEEGDEYGPGSYFVGLVGTSHGPHGSRNGCLLLTHWTGGPLDFIAD